MFMKKSKKILITGESGFIGSHVIKHFVNKYSFYEVHGLDVLTYAANRDYTKNLEKFPNYMFHNIDIVDTEKITNLFIKYQFTDIIHLAAESHVDNSITNPLLFAETNVLGTLNLLNAFKEYSSGRFLHVSTDEVYGELNIGDLPFDESVRYAPNSPYAASKASSDHFVHAYIKTYDIDAIITNCSNNYGPHQHVEKLIPKVINSIFENNPIPVYGKGENIRDWLYVKDHIDAIDLIFHKGQRGEKYNIGGNNEMSNLELINFICDLCVKKKHHLNPKSLISFVADRLGHDKRYAINYSKLRNHVGWEPKSNFKDALGNTIDWYVEQFKNY